MELLKTVYSQMLIRANRPALKDLESWVFHPGMLFTSLDKWWGDFGTREFPHEGIDLCLYHDRSGQTQKLSPHTSIPVIHDGIVRAMFKDYLGQAIIVEHAHLNGDISKFLTVYAHTKPQENIQPGAQVKKGEIIATIADTRHSKARILPHLHLTLALPARELAYEDFVWNIMRDPAMITLLDPLNLLKSGYHVSDKEGLA